MNLRWFSEAQQQLIRLLKLSSHGSKAILAFDLAITLFLGLCVAAFLVHDLIYLIASAFLETTATHYAIQVFSISAVVIVISILAIVLHEQIIKKHT